MKYYKAPIIIFTSILIIDLILTYIYGWNHIKYIIYTNFDLSVVFSILSLIISIFVFNIHYNNYKQDREL